MARVAFIATGSFALLALAAGCGGGGSSARTLQAAVTLALTGPALTDGDATTLHGATDLRARVVELSAGGVLASSPDGFATFGIDVALAPGDNAFTVESLDDRGRRRLHAGPSIRRETPLLSQTMGAALLPKSAGAIVTLTRSPAQLMRVDPATGDRTVISGGAVGSGDPLGDVREVIPFDGGRRFLVTSNFAAWWFVEAKTGDRTLHIPSTFGAIDATEDPDRDRLAYIDHSVDQVRAIDPVTLTETLVSDGHDGNSPALEFPVAVEYDANGDRFIVLDLLLPGVVAVDPDDGARKLLSDFADAGEGPSVAAPALLAIDGSRKLAWTVSQSTGDLFEIALGSGNRRIAIPGDAASGPSLLPPRGLCLLDSDRLVASVGDALMILDLAARRRTELARSRVGGGPDFASSFLQLRPIHDRRRNRLLFVDDAGGIRSIDLASGDRAIEIDAAGPGTPFLAQDLFVDDATGRCFALAKTRDAVVELDPRTFEVEVITSPTVGAGVPLAGALSLASDVPNGRLFVTDGFSPRRVAVVDLATGDRTTLAAAGDGGAVPLQTLLDVDYDPVLDRVLAIDLSISDVVVIDPATGARELFADHADPSVPPIEPLRICLDHGDHSAWLQGHDADNLPVVLRIDLDDGERTLVSGATVGRGPQLRRIDQLASDTANGRLWLFDSNFHGLVQVDLASGDRLIVSR